MNEPVYCNIIIIVLLSTERLNMCSFSAIVFFNYLFPTSNPIYKNYYTIKQQRAFDFLILESTFIVYLFIYFFETEFTIEIKQVTDR